MLSRLLTSVLMIMPAAACLVSCSDSKNPKEKVEVTMTSGGFVQVADKAQQTNASPTGAVSQAAVVEDINLTKQAYVEGLRLPIDYWPDGSIKTQLNADEAKVSQTNGVILAKGLRFDMLSQKGVSEMTVTTPDCTFDRVAGKAYSDESVKFEKQGLTITGTGYRWDTIGQKIYLSSDVTVVINRRVVANEKGLLR